MKENLNTRVEILELHYKYTASPGRICFLILVFLPPKNIPAHWKIQRRATKLILKLSNKLYKERSPFLNLPFFKEIPWGSNDLNIQNYEQFDNIVEFENLFKSLIKNSTRTNRQKLKLKRLWLNVTEILFIVFGGRCSKHFTSYV